MNGHSVNTLHSGWRLWCGLAEGTWWSGLRIASHGPYAAVSLQTRIVELEGRVRRAAAERGAVEMKKNEFQGELEKQREQLDKIKSSHNFQMESVNKLYQDEKARPT